MAKAYAESFYNNSHWRKVSKAFMQSKNYICERCGKPARICHHVKHITPQNIHDPEITMSWDNLECLCQECHTRHHLAGKECIEGLCFNSEGEIIKYE